MDAERRRAAEMQRELDSLQLEQQVKAPAMLSETEKAIQTALADIEATKRSVCPCAAARASILTEWIVQRLLLCRRTAFRKSAS
jgi:hypothetical protein